MFAVIETGGKQYRVQAGDVLDVELLPIEGKEREKIVFDRVLLVYGEGGTRVGNPVIPGARVEAELLHDTRGPKVRIFKKVRRKGYKRQGGHRQDYLKVRVQNIVI
ncbi:MAG: 50S ribosomal protein L21 [Thermoanaerobaculia bacterium]|jgi:large subunit ribosomal protein L21|nr:50S ribosomal protein L21 [Thermoanaerobaculia bacterium]